MVCGVCVWVGVVVGGGVRREEGVVVVVVLTVRINEISVDNAEQVHLIGVTERPGVRLPASPPPWASTSKWTEAENAAKLQQNHPSSALEHPVDERV